MSINNPQQKLNHSEFKSSESYFKLLSKVQAHFQKITILFLMVSMYVLVYILFIDLTFIKL